MAALFALLVQFTLSFGHVHVGEAGHGTNHFAQLAAPAATNAATPADPHHRHAPVDDLCAICLAGGMLAAGALATPPALPGPPVQTAALASFTAAPVAAPSRHVAFRSRAPPSA